MNIFSKSSMIDILIKRILSLHITKKLRYRLRRFFTKKRSRIPPPPDFMRSMVWGSESSNSFEGLPKIIWTYWEGTSSISAELCQETWKAQSTGYIINIVKNDNLHTFLPDLPTLPPNTPIQKKSNLIRLMLLERYGGIWSDYSTIFTAPISWIEAEMQKAHCGFFAFYNEFHDEYKRDVDRPIIENGFLAACKGNSFITQWREKYENCITSENYNNYFWRHPDAQDLVRNFLNKSKEEINYFVCYIAAQEVMKKKEGHRILLINAEDEYYHTYYNTIPPRSQRDFADELLLRTPLAQQPKLIKITGGHRIRLDDYLKYHCHDKRSTLGKIFTLRNSMRPNEHNHD